MHNGTVGSTVGSTVVRIFTYLYFYLTRIAQCQHHKVKVIRCLGSVHGGENSRPSKPPTSLSRGMMPRTMPKESEYRTGYQGEETPCCLCRGLIEKLRKRRMRHPQRKAWPMPEAYAKIVA